jgi:hypothetical protein
MSRIAALQPPYAPDIQQQFDRIMRGAPPLMLFRVIAGNARAWEKFRAGSLLDRGPLSLREREIVIDRTCALTGCGGRPPHRGADPRHGRGWTRRGMLVGGRAGFGRNRRCAASPRHAGRSGIPGAGGALRRGADLRDHPALRLLSHRVIYCERARSAAGGQGGAVSGGRQLRKAAATLRLRAGCRADARCRPACQPR